MANNYFDSLLLSLLSMAGYVSMFITGLQKPLMVQAQVWISTVNQTKNIKNYSNLHPQILMKSKGQLDGDVCRFL